MDYASSSGRKVAYKSKVIGIPRACGCGSALVPMISRSDRNPCRRYYRCVHAVNEKLYGETDNHMFKWIDDALVEEVGMLQNSIDRLENVVLAEIESVVTSVAENFVMDKVERIVEERVNTLVIEKLDEMVAAKLDVLVGETLEKLAMEKVQEEIMCMKLSG